MGGMKSGISLWRHGLLALALAVMTLLIIDFNSRMGEWRRLSLQRESVGAQVTALYETQTQLETRVAHANSPAGVAEWAYQDGHWVREGDILVVPMEQGGVLAVPTPGPAPTPHIIRNWQLWLALFFDQLLP
jgi:hypothetical protein